MIDSINTSFEQFDWLEERFPETTVIQHYGATVIER